MESAPQNNDTWKKFYEMYEDTKHQRSLEGAVRNYVSKQTGEALDIGAGNLRDTKYLLQEGFRVTAVDPEPASEERARELSNENLTFIKEKIGGVELPRERFDIVSAQGILFHFPKERLELVIKQISTSLVKDGILSANFLGPNDSWNTPTSNAAFLDKDQLALLLHDFEILQLNEKEEDKESGIDTLKHWHWMQVIARKK
jgi:tellurite methyltransferase